MLFAVAGASYLAPSGFAPTTPLSLRPSAEGFTRQCRHSIKAMSLPDTSALLRLPNFILLTSAITENEK
jgi:hypothetical protein